MGCSGVHQDRHRHPDAKARPIAAARSGKHGSPDMSSLDYVLVAVYLLLVCGVAVLYSGRQKSLKDYFLGGRNIPWYAAAFSGVATIVSATSFLGAPGLAYAGNYQFLQYRLALPLVLAVICGVVLPAFFRFEMYSIYEYLERRFDRRVRLLASGLFLLLKAGYLAIAIYAPAVVLARISGVPTAVFVVLVGVVTTLYTMAGGIKAVIWTDTLQLGIFVSAIIVILVFIAHRVQGGFAGIVAVAGANGKMSFFNLSTSLSEPYSLPACLLGGTVYMLSQFGVDQAEMQRFLTTRNLQRANLAMTSSMLAAAVVGLTLFFIGSALFVFYREHPERLAGRVGSNEIFATFIIHELPSGVKGVLVAAILAAGMSAISTVLNSMATVTLTDLWAARARRAPTVNTGRWVTLAYGTATTLLASMGDRFGNILEASIRVANLFGGTLVGAFLLGLIFPRATTRGALYGMMAGFTSAAYLWTGTSLASLWYGLVSMLVVFGVGLTVSFFDGGAGNLHGKSGGAMAPGFRR